jgi:uncharacterized protein
VSRLDPRHPLVVDTRLVARRPGQMAVIERTVPASERLGVDVVALPEGSPIELALRLESVIEGVLISGTATAQAQGECVRCLDPVVIDLEVEMQELFAYPETAAADADEIETLEDELVDIGPMLRDAVVLALPLQPVCSVDCRGLCPTCGIRLADDPEHAHEQVDPRWAALRHVAADVATEDVPTGTSE